MADQPLESINISLPRAMAEFVDKRVQGRFGNRSEYIRSLIREDEDRQRRTTLEQLLLDGLNSGPGREWVPADFDALRARLRDEHARRS